MNRCRSGAMERKKTMANGRRAVPSLKFNGKNVDTSLAPYLKSVTYTDVACGDSDTVSISLQNIDMKWLKGWYPVKGDKISASIALKDWDKEGEDKKLACGSFILDDISFKGGPLEATFSGIAIPAKDSFKTRERTKTWKDVTVSQIGSEISGRYGLAFQYDAPAIRIKALEQSEKTDSAFLYEVAKTYGLAMKVYRSKIIMFDKGRYEGKKAVTKITRESFIDDGWEYNDTLEGTYTGARISYKNGKNNDEISLYVGLGPENAKGSRILKINETADDAGDARLKAAARVNEANEKTTTLTGTIWAKPKIAAGVTVNVQGLARADGKYFVDKVSTEVSDSGTTMGVEMHKCQKRL